MDFLCATVRYRYQGLVSNVPGNIPTEPEFVLSPGRILALGIKISMHIPFNFTPCCVAWKLWFSSLPCQSRTNQIILTCPPVRFSSPETRTPNQHTHCRCARLQCCFCCFATIDVVFFDGSVRIYGLGFLPFLTALRPALRSDSHPSQILFLDIDHTRCQVRRPNTAKCLHRSNTMCVYFFVLELVLAGMVIFFLWGC